MCRRTYRDSTCDRPGAVYSRLRLPSPRRQTTSVSTTHSSEHQSRLLNVIIPRGWIQRRRCQYIVSRRTVTLVLISRQCRQCLPREFHRTVSLGRPRRISYGISSGKDLLMRVRPPWKRENSPLISTSMPGCPYRMTSYTGTAMVDADTTYGLQLHHPRFLEFIGAPESARLLNHSPSFWVDRLGQKSAMAAAVNLQRDAGFMMLNLQILAQFVMSLHRMSSEMLSIGVDHVVFPVEEVDKLSLMPRAQRAAKYMTAMGLWRPPSGPGAPGPLPTSTCRKETSTQWQ